MESFVGSHFLLSRPVSLQFSSHASQKLSVAQNETFVRGRRSNPFCSFLAPGMKCLNWDFGVKGRVSYPNQITGNTVLGHEQVIF